MSRYRGVWVADVRAKPGTRRYYEQQKTRREAVEGFKEARASSARNRVAGRETRVGRTL